MSKEKKEKTKVVSMTSKPVTTAAHLKQYTVYFTELIEATDYRIGICKNLRQDLQAHFKVNRIMLLDEWDTFYPALMAKIKTDEEFVTLQEIDFNKAAYFIYYIGSFFKYNGKIDVGEEDEKYVQNVYDWLLNNKNYVADQEVPEGQDGFDFEDFFYKAFPEC